MINQIDIEFIRTATLDSISDNKHDKITGICTMRSILITTNNIYNIQLPNKTTIVNHFKSLVDNLK